MFCIAPELNVGRLFSGYMRSNEAIAIIGSEQFSLPKGYGWSFQYGGPFQDPSLIKENVLQSYIVAIDAVDYRSEYPEMQYEKPDILRDLNKSFAAFSISKGPANIATGNWGCGVFGGDAEFKILLQWMSASMAGRTMDYYPFDHENIALHYPDLVAKIRQKGLRVDQVAEPSTLGNFRRVARPLLELA